MTLYAAGCAMQDFTDRQLFFKSIDLISAHKHLKTAAEDIAQLRRSFEAVLIKASTITSTWGLPRQFQTKEL